MNIASRYVGTLALILGSAALAGCGAEASGAPAEESTSVVQRAPEYVGDPWEKRYREQFWARQHIHDSWNPCHLGENVPTALQGHGPHCWDRLPGRH